MNIDKITIQDINLYRKRLENEIIKLGESNHNIRLIKDATIKNAIRKNRNPKDVAWSIIQ